MKKINWLDHLVNLIVVVSGISLAFTLNSWKSKKDGDKLKIIYIQSMIDELSADMNDLGLLIDDDSLQYIALVKTLSYSELSDDSLSWVLRRLGNVNTFSEHNNTYESIKSSGKIELFDDVQLWFSITENYRTNYSQISAIEKYYEDHFNNYILPYYMDEFVKGKASIHKTFESLKFKSRLGLYISFLNQKSEAYKAALSSSTNLKNELVFQLEDLN